MSHQSELKNEASNNNICKFVNCKSNKTTDIIVKIGEQQITLKLCKVCIMKFEQDDTLVKKNEEFIND